MMALTFDLVVFCVFISYAFCCGLRQDSSKISEYTGQHIRAADNPRNVEEREKRGISILAKGTAALTTLLRGATPTRTKLLNSRIYVKPGNVDTALKDFHSLKSIKSASDVKEFEYEKGKLLMRYVGDREITLYPSGDWWTKGRPFMDVKVIRGSFWDERVTRIIYKTVDN